MYQLESVDFGIVGHVIIHEIPILVALHSTKKFLKDGATHFGDREEGKFVLFQNIGGSIPSESPAT